MTKFDEIMNSDTKPDYAKIERAIAEKYGIDPDAILPKFPQTDKLPTEAERDFLTVAEQRRDALYSKLESGYEAIEAAIERGDSDEVIKTWERFWEKLRREYETVCEEIRRNL